MSTSDEDPSIGRADWLLDQRKDAKVTGGKYGMAEWREAKQRRIDKARAELQKARDEGADYETVHRLARIYDEESDWGD